MRKIVIVIIALFYCLSGYSQSNWIKEADKEASLFNYFEALELYEKEYSRRRGDSLMASRGLIKCYWELRDYQNVFKWSEIAMSKKQSNDIDSLNYAKALHYLGKYQDAINIYSEIKNDSIDVAYMIKSCKYAIYQIEKKPKYIIKNIPINSKQNDWGVSIYNDTILAFASDRINNDKYKRNSFFDIGADNNINKKYSSWTGLPYVKLFITNKKAGIWSNPTYFFEDQQNEYNNSSPTFYSNKEIYFSRTTAITKPKKYIHDKSKFQEYTIALELVSSKKDSLGKWKPAEPFIYNAPLEYSITDVCFSADKKIMIFSSNKNGKDDLDLFVSKIDSLGIWSEPYNIGDKINSEYNERFPFLDEAGNLYFSSNRPLGMGGLDIYFSENIGSMDFKEPQNMGYPINCAQDDFNLVIDRSNNSGYLSSNRINGLGGDDIYQFEIKKYYIKGTVIDSISKKNLADVTVILKNVNTNKVDSVITKQNGEFYFEISYQDEYLFIVNNNNYFYDKDKYYNINNADNKVVIEVSEAYNKKLLELNNENYFSENSQKFDKIYFDQGKSILSQKSKDELNLIISFIKENKDVKIEVNSYADSKGSDSYNLKLSNKRGHSVAKYLQDNGISLENIILLSHGESKLLNDCTDYRKCSEDQLKINRRVEFNIIYK